ncbi:hypothetical protein V6Z11_A11G110400 [Gossypium hirsutum]|uniref:Uncharacterized protein n=1 Tax=Gossypium hirsutum TaxID=3635 RepID=A0ABM2Z450_GOSHI|nr:uncharacterized protein LOC107924153 [Gossypium hirsutum]
MWATSLAASLPYLPAPIPIHTRYPFPLNVRLPRHPTASNQDDGKEISGSDVLWALQRAAAHKKKANRKKTGSASLPEATQRLEDTIDYTNVKPLQIRTEWSLKLDELEKRLHVLQQEAIFSEFDWEENTSSIHVILSLQQQQQ